MSATIYHPSQEFEAYSWQIEIVIGHVQAAQTGRKIVCQRHYLVKITQP